MENDLVVKIPYDVACFTWLFTTEKVLTNEILQQERNATMLRCYLCNEQVETINHLFFCTVNGHIDYGKI
uniref:Putative ovule protein n=1 Tax=Solanum chacoense TaxID=4108 RepID=A0A0V0H872_SOLCH